MTRQDFINNYGDYIISVTNGTGIFPETLVAQAIIESSDNSGNVGASTLASKYNNYFGIKADSRWTGKSINMKTGEYTGTPDATTINAYFRAYDSPQDSIQDYVNFLKKNSRYASAGVFNASSPQEQGQLLQKAGYATGAGYGNLVGQIASEVHGALSAIKAGAGSIVGTQNVQEFEDITKKGITTITQSPLLLVAGVGMIGLALFMTMEFFRTNDMATAA